MLLRREVKILRMSQATLLERSSALRAALHLEIITLVWMVIEAAVASAPATVDMKQGGA
jgi:hypothetical protein